MADRLFLGIDLGGTNMQVGVVDADGGIAGRARARTPAREGSDAIIDAIAATARAACAEAGVETASIAAVGIAAAGAVDVPHGVVLDAPNIGWEDFPLGDRLEAALGRPVIVDNDVNGAVWGEHRLGAGRGRGDVLGVWVGTGVGGGLVLHDRLHHGEFFTAGEIGQTILFPDGPEGGRIVEDLCSRTGMSRIIMERLAEFPDSVLHELTAPHGRVAYSRDFETARAAADPLAIEVIDRGADLLGLAIANWVTVLALDTVILGGGIAEALGAPYLDRIRAAFDRHVFPDRCRACRIEMTALTADAGLLGAALLAAEASGRT
ncbi:MAG: ROK family protein [Planctomycetota bacterium]|jgi:glucokinase